MMLRVLSIISKEKSKEIKAIMEIWNDIPGYEGYYQASTYGRIKGLDYNVCEKTGKVRIHKGHILKSFKVPGGYSCISLQVNGNRKHFLIHRLIALTFIPNPHNLQTVNHKDENKKNNHVENLEWMTLYENNRFGTHDIRMKSSLSKSIKQYALDGTFIREFESLADVHKTLGFSAASINKAANGKYKSSNGYIWKY